MKKLVAICALLLAGNAVACFKSGEQTSGMNKICYYKCVDGTRAITISSTSLCPLSLNRPLTDDDLVESPKGPNGLYEVVASLGVRRPSSVAECRIGACGSQLQ